MLKRSGCCFSCPSKFCNFFTEFWPLFLQEKYVLYLLTPGEFKAAPLSNLQIT